MPGELPSLLFRQRLLLAVLAGSVSLRDAVLGVALFALVIIVPRFAGARRALTAAVFFLLGLGLTFLASPSAPDCPSWASVPRKSVLVEGRVASVTGLPGGRVRVLLEEVRPMEGMPQLAEETKAQVRKALDRKIGPEFSGGRKGYPGRIVEDDASPVPGLVSLTLQKRDMAHAGRPVAGETLRALMRLYPTVGSVNPGVSDLGRYWADRDVWHNARLNRTAAGPLYLELAEGEGLAYRAQLLRESWRKALSAELFDESAGGNFGGWRASDSRAEEVLPQGRAMLPALLFGDRSFLSPHTVDLFNRAGLVHSLALSGQHLALAAMAGAALIFLASRAFRGLFLVMPRRVLVVSAGVPFALAYLFLGGAPFSLIRAACMMLAGSVYLCLRRSTASLDALFAACLLLFLGWPLAAFDLSAQLSVLAVAGILLSMPLVSALRRRFPPARRPGGDSRSRLRRALHAAIRWSGTMLILSLAAQLAVLPVIVSVFGATSVQVWMNLIWLPPLTFVTLPAAALGMLLLACLGPQSCSTLLFAAATFPADIMLDILERMAEAGALPLVQFMRPLSLSALGYGAALTGGMLMLGRKLNGLPSGEAARRLLCLGLLMMPAGQMPVWFDDWRAAREREVALTVFDVGQGQAVLLSYPGGRVLVDGGGSASPTFDCGRSILAPALTYGRMPRLDAVIVSHTDMDHARGLRWILEHFEVGSLCWSALSARDDSADGRALREIAARRGIPERILGRGDVMELAEGIRLEMVWPDKAETEPRPGRKISSNAASLSFRVIRDEVPLAILCGDMTAPALRRLAESGQDLRAGLLVLPHHGAASSFQRKFYDAVSPEAAAASAAAFNHYGFPGRRVRAEMARRLIPLYSTTMLGGFTVTWSGKDGRMTLP